MFTLYYKKQIETLDHAQGCQERQTAALDRQSAALSDLAQEAVIAHDGARERADGLQDDRNRMVKVCLRGCDLLDKTIPVLSKKLDLDLDQSTSVLRQQIRTELEKVGS